MFASQKIQTRAVLAAAYRGRLDTCLTHTLDATTGKVLCGRVQEAHLADPCTEDVDSPPTCPVCWNRDPRRARPTPRTYALLLTVEELELVNSALSHYGEDAYADGEDVERLWEAVSEQVEITLSDAKTPDESDQAAYERLMAP